MEIMLEQELSFMITDKNNTKDIFKTDNYKITAQNFIEMEINILKAFFKMVNG